MYMARKFLEQTNQVMLSCEKYTVKKKNSCLNWEHCTMINRWLTQTCFLFDGIITIFSETHLRRTACMLRYHVKILV